MENSTTYLVEDANGHMALVRRKHQVDGRPLGLPIIVSTHAKTIFNVTEQRFVKCDPKSNTEAFKYQLLILVASGTLPEAQSVCYDENSTIHVTRAYAVPGSDFYCGSRPVHTGDNTEAQGEFDTFSEDQWWYKELQAVCVEPDQIRALAVVRNLINQHTTLLGKI